MNDDQTIPSQLQQKLSEPKTLERLSRLLDRLDSFEETLDAIEFAKTQGPGLIGAVTDTVDEVARQAASAGIDIEQRGRAMLELLEKLSSPEITKTLSLILSHGKELGEGFEILLQAPQLAAMAADSIDEVFQRANEAGLDLHHFIGQAGKGAEKVIKASNSKEFDKLIESGILEPKALELFSGLAQALTTQEKSPKSIGIFGLLGAMGDPDVQRSVGFFIHIAKNVGQYLKSQEKSITKA